MSKIRDELMKAGDVAAKRGEDHNDLGRRIVLAVQDLSDKDWNKLSEPAQDWFNEAATAYNEKKDIPPFPDAEKADADEKPARSRTRAADPEPEKEPEVEAYVPKRKDEVKVTNKRGKVYQGKVVEIDDEVIVIDTGDGEEEIARDRIESIEPLGGAGKAGKADEPESSEPEKGDTVQVTTSRDKVVMGKILEIDDEAIVLVDTSGDEHEFSRDRLKSVVVKAKGSAPAGRPSKKDEDADEKPTTRRTAAKDKDEGGEAEKGGKTRVTKADNGGVSATTRIRELIADNLDASKDEIAKMATKEGLQFKDNTLQLIYTDCTKFVKMLRERKLLK